jgi:cytochrome c oxidase cbb3-type subunit 3
VRYWISGVLLVAAAAGLAEVAGQHTRTPTQEGIQQQQGSQSTRRAQQAEDMRQFLGLGPAPDKVAASRGERLFDRECAFCHGQQARGATGPSLITSDLVLADNHGEHLTPFLKKGRPGSGMPAFATMSNQELKDIAEYLHLQVEDVANRGTYRVLNIVVGNPGEGKAYVEGHCEACHSAETFAHIGSRFSSADQLQRYWIWPARSREVRASVKTQKGSATGRLAQISDFRVALVDGSGETLTFARGPGVEVQVDDPLEAHQQMLTSLANDDMHNVTAYFETLK